MIETSAKLSNPMRVAVGVSPDETVRRQGRRRSSGQEGETRASSGDTPTATSSYDLSTHSRLQTPQIGRSLRRKRSVQVPGIKPKKYLNIAGLLKTQRSDRVLEARSPQHGSHERSVNETAQWL
jgi:hypothetical protein